MTPENGITELLTAAVQQHEHGDLPAAAALYRQVLALAPDHPDALHLLGLIAQATGDLTGAIAYIRRALVQRPGEAVFQYNLANVQAAAGHLDEAIQSYRTALVTRPDDTDTLLNLGNALARRGDMPAAADCYRRVLTHAPHLHEAQANLAQVLRALGDVAGARAAYQAVVAIDAGHPAALIGLGALSQEAGEYETALHHYLAALQRDPDSAAAWNNLGTWYQERGEPAHAADCYRHALTRDPQDAEAHNNLGTLLADAGRHAEAEACYRAALRVRPAFAEAHKNHGVVLQALGRRELALASFREAVRLRPEFTEAAYKLAALSGEQAPATAPADYVTALFDSYAGDYDRHLTSTLQYRVPQALGALFAEQVEVTGGLDVLDLGCGTGLSGAPLRRLARHLTGIDLSARMLAQARERGLYDQLIEGDIVQVLSAGRTGFDLAVAADVFVYIGDLQAVLAGVAQAVRAGGWLLFSVESLPAGEYRLQSTGRYAHAPAYLAAMASLSGFESVAARAVTLRVEQGKPVAGQLHLWQRRAL